MFPRAGIVSTHRFEWLEVGRDRSSRLPRVGSSRYPQKKAVEWRNHLCSVSVVDIQRALQRLAGGRWYMRSHYRCCHLVSVRATKQGSVHERLPHSWCTHGHAAADYCLVINHLDAVRLFTDIVLLSIILVSKFIQSFENFL